MYKQSVVPSGAWLTGDSGREVIVTSTCQTEGVLDRQTQ
jgi:hypothetical protein